MKKITDASRSKLGTVLQITLLLLWLPIAAFGEGRGEGPTFSDPEDIAIDSINNRVLVVDQILNTLFSVDLTSGDRTIISSLTTGTGEGPQFDYPDEVAFDSANNRALVVNSLTRVNSSYSWSLFSVDLASGNRALISDNTIGTGPKFYIPQGLALDSLNNRALVVGRETYVGLFAVGLGNGNRSVISDQTTGAGPAFSLLGLEDVVMDSLNNRALVVDIDTLFSVDLASGNRTVISHKLVGVGPEFKFPYAITLDSDNNRALVLDGQLFSVDLASGNRTVISDFTAGAGLEFNPSRRTLALDSAHNRALVVGYGNHEDFSHFIALVGVDLDTGYWTIISE